MYNLLFRNWKFALLWACGICFSAAAFIVRGGAKPVEAIAAQPDSKVETVDPQTLIAPTEQDDDDEDDSDGWADSREPRSVRAD